MANVGRMAQGRWPRTAHAAAALLALAALTACMPDPAPTPSPTGFASDEEAFAAAEDTYRAYIDALNARRDDEASVPSPESFLTGAALTAAIDTDTEFRETGMKLVGVTDIAGIKTIDATRDSASIGVCLDASNTRVVDASGTDITPPDRQDRLGLIVEVVWAPDRSYISSTTASEEEC